MSENFLESDAEIKKWNEVRLFRVRHGVSAYKEHEKTLQEGEDDLTEEGIRQIEQSADRISDMLDPATDIVAVISSTRRRAIDSASIIRERLTQKGFTVWDDPKKRDKRDDIRSADLEAADNSSVPIRDPRYLEAMREISEASVMLEEGYMKAWAQEAQPASKQYHRESYDSISKRSRDHLALLMRVARRVQPAIGRHLVIIEVEHSESIAEFLDIASGGTQSLRGSGYEIPNGNFVELSLPVEGDIIRSTLHVGDTPTELNPVEFNAKRREFKHGS